MGDLQDKATDLGMNQRIDRRDFLGGLAAGALVLANRSAAEVDPPPAAPTPADAVPSGPYPPLLNGLRGQYPGSFEVAHAARDGSVAGVDAAQDLGEHHDLVIVGGGISGLSAAYFFRKALGDDKKILILDNHDDFGGHAKRNEFRHDGRMYVSYGGTMSIETPFPYSYTAKSVIADLGIDVSSRRRYERPEVYRGLERGVFFDREHFGGDRVVPGFGKRNWQDFFASAPLSPRVRADLIRIHTARTDYLAQWDPPQKVEMLKRMSYQDYLLKHAKLLPESLPFFSGMAFRNNMRVDTCPAYTAARSEAPGFAGMELPGEPVFKSDYEFHFPDGNASIARLLVARLIPGVFPGPQTPESIVSAMAHYDRLDTSETPTRIRLSSTAVRIEHVGDPRHTDKVRVVYVRDGKAFEVTAGNAIMACFNNILPYIVPSLPEDQKHALAYASKVPMQYTNVLIRNWQAWQKLGVHWIEAPNGYHTWVALDIPVSIGQYACPNDPNEPIVVHMVRNPNAPGKPRKEQQRLGRLDMLQTPFSKIEMEIRMQLARMLGPGGFDASRDILAITVNRWPHGYAYTYDTVGDPDIPDAERPHVLGRRAFGRISIANADAGAAAFTNVAIDQAQRAVQDCLLSRGLT